MHPIIFDVGRDGSEQAFLNGKSASTVQPCFFVIIKAISFSGSLRGIYRLQEEKKSVLSLELISVWMGIHRGQEVPGTQDSGSEPKLKCFNIINLDRFLK
jgi:hypothetical protein